MVWQHRGESRADTEMALWPHRPTEPSDQASVYSLPVELISADLQSGVECSIIVNFNGAVMSVLRLHMTEIVKANPAQRAVWVWGMCKPCYLVSICRGGGGRVCYYYTLKNKPVTYIWREVLLEDLICLKPDTCCAQGWFGSISADLTMSSSEWEIKRRRILY